MTLPLSCRRICISPPPTLFFPDQICSNLQTNRRLVLNRAIISRYSSSQVKVNAIPDAPDYSPKTALLAVESKSSVDGVNPPRSVLPPLLQLPVRNPEDNIFPYLFRLGKAYGGFYKDGVKAVWFNNKAAKLLRQRIVSERGVKSVEEAARKQLMTRAEWQLLARNDHDIGKLPLFGLLALVFGEWLPLLVPFMPAVVPGTCRIPKQITGMRNSAEVRRRTTFRRGITEPSAEQITAKVKLEKSWAVTDQTYVNDLLETLRSDQLLHLSATLNLHNRLWDVLQIPPPSSILRRHLSKRLSYLSIDDALLLSKTSTNKAAAQLNAAELAIACEERGMDVLAKRDDALRQELTRWLSNQQSDDGRGRILLTMLFRRPNAWPNTKKT